MVRFDTPIPLKKGATLYVNATSDANCQLYAVVQRGEGSGNVWVNWDYICKDGDYMLYWYYIVTAGATVDLEHIPYVGYMEEVVPYRAPIVCDVSNLVQKFISRDGMKVFGIGV